MANPRKNNGNTNNFRPPPGMGTKAQAPLVAERFPVHSLQEFQLSSGDTVTGRVYCTDELTSIVVLQSPLVHTTLSKELRMVNVQHITKSRILDETEASELAAVPEQPLVDIQQKVLDDRERKATKAAMERLTHINREASPVGQAVFDRLLKACGSEVVWDRAGTGSKSGNNQHSILVLGQVRVEAPYTSNDCHAIGDQQTSTLERVQKIVETANTESASVVANASSSNGAGQK